MTGRPKDKQLLGAMALLVSGPLLSEMRNGVKSLAGIHREIAAGAIELPAEMTQDERESVEAVFALCADLETAVIRVAAVGEARTRPAPAPAAPPIGTDAALDLIAKAAEKCGPS